MTSRPLSCAEAFALLDDYVDRELASAEVAAVRTHLEHCAKCAEEFTVEAELLAAIRQKLAKVRMPDELMARISARLARE